MSAEMICNRKHEKIKWKEILKTRLKRFKIIFIDTLKIVTCW